MKIFIGFENISSTVTDIQGSFRASGHECYTALIDYPPVVELNTADFILNRELNKVKLFKPRRISVPLKNWWDSRVKRRFFNFCLERFDIFIFLWNSFEPDFSDLEILKKAGKKIVFIFAGDDVRWRSAASQELEKYGMAKIPVEEEFYTQKYLKGNLKRLRLAEKYADVIFSRTDQAQLQLKPYQRWNMMVNPANYKHNASQRKENPVIVHAPTSRKIKGTEYVYKAFDRLKAEGIAFTPILIENTPHEKALEIYQDADIIVDQLILPGTGKFASEGLAMGKVVVSLMGYHNYPQNPPPDCPVVDAGIDTIYQVLKELIGDHAKRTELAARGRSYVERNLHPKYFCEKVISLCADANSIAPDYRPEFFRNDFFPEAENISVYNEGTLLVKDCDWYKNNIKQGEREGLKF